MAWGGASCVIANVMQYLVDGHEYGLSYSKLREDYHRFRAMPDEQWQEPETLWDVLHFCCIVGYLKEMNGEMLVSDLGIIHEIVHLAKGISQRSLRDIREQFAKVMALA